MQYRRAREKGGTYFFTVVTHKRCKILCYPENVELLRQIFRLEMRRRSFRIAAFVLLPEDLHCIWTLPAGDNDFSTRWRLIKSAFSRTCNDRYKQAVSGSRKSKKEQAIWQRRFWEHRIRDDDDYKRHVEYIHYNPVKHDLASAPKEWLYSSFHHHVRAGLLDMDWGAGVAMEFGQVVGKE